MLRVAPCETLKFLECNNNEVGIHVTCCCTVPVMYKIQTTAPEKFRVRPRCGVLDPQQTVHICIILKPECRLNEYPKDRFLVLGALAPLECDLSTPQRVAEAWKQKFGKVNCTGVEQHRLTCMYGTKEQMCPQQTPTMAHQLHYQQQTQLQQHFSPQLSTHSQAPHQQQQLEYQPQYQTQYQTQSSQFPSLAQSQEIQAFQTPQMPQTPKNSLQSEVMSQATQSYVTNQAPHSSYQSTVSTAQQAYAPGISYQSNPVSAQRSSFQTGVSGSVYPYRNSIQSTVSETEYMDDDDDSANLFGRMIEWPHRFEKRLRLTTALQYVTLLVLLVVSVAVVFLLRREVKASSVPPLESIFQVEEGTSIPPTVSLRSKLTNTLKKSLRRGGCKGKALT